MRVYFLLAFPHFSNVHNYMVPTKAPSLICVESLEPKIYKGIRPYKQEKEDIKLLHHVGLLMVSLF